ncbi:MAG: hypothetical protein JXK07_01010 [Spirochaetes bacterium]|nr:hypothetical protein [Spirochaetota bacterium]
MGTTGCLVEGPKKRCYTMPTKVAVEWDSTIVYCGFRATYEVTLTGVTGNTIVKVFCRTSEGELLDKSELHTSLAFFMDQVLIPFNVEAGTSIYIEIQLPEYGVLCKSVCKTVHNSFSVKTYRILSETR